MMKSTLHLKFIILYIVFGFLSLFTAATLGEHLMYNRVLRSVSENIYKESYYLAQSYLPAYFSGDTSPREIQVQLSAAQLYLDSALWFVDADGNRIAFANI